MIIAICDDEQKFIDKIEAVIQKVEVEREAQIPAEIVKFLNGNSLLEYCKKQYVNAIFLDIDMPGFDGFEVLKSLNDMKKRRWWSLSAAWMSCSRRRNTNRSVLFRKAD